MSKNKEDNLENLGLKSHYYQMKFTPQEFIHLLISVLFKVVRFCDEFNP